MKTNTECPVCHSVEFLTEPWLEMLNAVSNGKRVILVVCNNCGNVYAREKE